MLNRIKVFFSNGKNIEKFIFIPLIVLILISFISAYFVINYFNKKSSTSDDINTEEAFVLSSQVKYGSDDSTLMSQVFNNVSDVNKIGKENNSSINNFLRFTDLSIEKNTKIDSAYIRLGISGSQGGVINAKIAVFERGDAIAPSSTQNFIQYQNKLFDETITWNNISHLDSGKQIKTPNIALLIQNIVSRDDWEKGNSILIWVGDNGSDYGSNISYYTRDNPKSINRPELLVNFATSTPTATQTPITTLSPTNFDTTQTPTASPTPNNTGLPESLVFDTGVSTQNPTPTITTTSTPTSTLTPTSTGTATPTPTDTPTPSPTATPTPTPTDTPTPSPPMPTDTPTPSPTVTPTPTLVTTTASFPVTYNNTSDLYYKELTMIADIGNVTSASVASGAINIPSTYNSLDGTLVFTTSLSPITITLQSDSVINSVSVSKAVLKENKKWAWSHGFDDNVNLKASVDVLDAKGWNATFFLIGNIVDPTRDESWIVDRPYLAQKLNEGWAIGNHTWTHECSPTDNTDATSEISQDYTVLQNIIAASSKTSYIPIAFAAPCFVSNYDSAIATIIANHQYGIKFNESQGNELMIINQGASNYSNGSYSADAVTSTTQKIGRDTDIDGSESAVLAKMDWMSANATPSRAFWYNSLLHGNRETNLQTVVNYAYTNYGPGGTDELWMAPSDEVYSYLIVRDNAVIGTVTIS